MLVKMRAQQGPWRCGLWAASLLVGQPAPRRMAFGAHRRRDLHWPQRRLQHALLGEVVLQRRHKLLAQLCIEGQLLLQHPPAQRNEGRGQLAALALLLPLAGRANCTAAPTSACVGPGPRTRSPAPWS